MKIIIALIIFSVIVIIHELGHFLLAKKNGITVTEFSLGMGPRILSFQGKHTRYSWKLLPIGGSCMMLGEDDTCEDPGAFNKKGVWARISTIAAGPIFNFLLAFFLAIFVISGVGYDPAEVTTVIDGYPAANAGLQAGDMITSIGGSSVDIARDIDVYYQFHPIKSTEQKIKITYERDGQEYETVLSPVNYDSYMLGFRYMANTSNAVVGEITEGYPMQAAGLQVNDVITKIDGTPITTGENLSAYFNKNPLSTKEITVTYERDGVEQTVSVTPKLASSSLTLGFNYNLYRTGRETNPIKVLKYSFTEVKFWIKTTVGGLGQMLSGNVSRNDIAGPVGIVNIIGDSYESAKQVSPMYTFLQMAYISILLSANLGVMNLLPIPALDGGRLLFLLVEAIRGKPIDPEKEGMIHMIGFFLLMAFMLFVVFNDVVNIFF